MSNKTIIVMGPTGSGKSSFIRNAIPEGMSTDIQVGHHIDSETSQVHSIHWITENGVGVNLVDTPGFDDSREGVTDADILTMIADFLTQQYREGASKLTGFIYIHRISDPRVGGTSKRNLRMFEKLCGEDSFKNVAIVTTMWDRVTPEDGQRREQELQMSDDLFKALMDGGATMARHDGTRESALKVIMDLFHKNETVAQIVRELEIEKKGLLDTEAGVELQSEVRNVLQKHQEDLRMLEDEIREAKQQRKKRMEEEAAAGRQKVLEDIAKLRRELEKLGDTSDTGISRRPPSVVGKINTLHPSDATTRTPRIFCVPAIFIFAAFVLLFIVSISLPYLSAMDITRVHTSSSSATALSGSDTTTELRFGIWAYCYDLANGNRVCSSTGHGYSVTVTNTQGNSITIGPSWTRGLAVHPVAAGVTFIALLLALSQHITVTLFASLVSFIAALLTFIAFIIDIALYAYIKNQMENLGFSGSATITGPGFWLTFTSMLLLLLGGCTVCFGRRRVKMANATPATVSSSKGGFFSRFKRNQ